MSDVYYSAIDQEDADVGAAMQSLYENGGYTGAGASSPGWVDGTPWYDRIAQGIGGAFTAWTAFQKARDSYSLGLAQTRTDTEIARLRAQTDLTKAQIAERTAIARANNELRYAQMGLQAPTLGGLFYGGGSSGTGYNIIMLMLTAAGVFLAWKAIRK